MKICFPVESNQGMNSQVYGHFGSAPMFLVADTESSEIKEVDNGDKNHAHGACRPLRAIGGEAVDAIVVGGIGAGAIQGLNQAGLKVYRAQKRTIAENLELFQAQALEEMTPGQACAGHHHGHSCGGH